MIHLVFGASATGTLKHTLHEQNNTIIGFPVDFSVGPITNIHEKSGINHYFTWLKSSFNTGEELLENDQIAYQQSLQKLMGIEDGEQVTIWTCENATEQIGLRISCYLLRDKKVDLGMINTYDAIHDYMKHKDIQMDIRHTGECNTEQIRHFYKHSIGPIPGEIKSDYVQDGERLLNSKSMLRSWRLGEVIDDVETRDDAFILECVTRIHSDKQSPAFIKAARVIGEVVGHLEYPVSDSWIEYRIRSLIHANQLTYKGSLHSMRTYNIKIV